MSKGALQAETSFWSSQPPALPLAFPPLCNLPECNPGVAVKYKACWKKHTSVGSAKPSQNSGAAHRCQDQSISLICLYFKRGL